MNEGESFVQNYLVPPLEILADRAYQDVAWVRRREVDAVCYSEVIEMFLHACHGFLDSEYPSELPQDKRVLLSELRDLVISFDCAIDDRAYKNTLVVDHPKWDKIREKARDLLGMVKIIHT